MSDFLDELQGLSAAEEFFDFLEVEYDPKVVRVNRLHILKKYQQYLAKAEGDESDEAALRATHRACLARAHLDFTTSSAQQEKLFKVFQDESAKAFVGLDAIQPIQRGV